MDDRCGRVESTVRDGVAGPDAFAGFQHVIQNRAADRDLFQRLGLARIVSVSVTAGGRLPNAVVQQHHTTSIGDHPIEHQFENPLEHLVQIFAAADRQRRAVHDVERCLGVDLRCRRYDASRI